MINPNMTCTVRAALKAVGIQEGTWDGLVLNGYSEQFRKDVTREDIDRMLNREVTLGSNRMLLNSNGTFFAFCSGTILYSWGNVGTDRTGQKYRLNHSTALVIQPEGTGHKLALLTSC